MDDHELAAHATRRAAELLVELRAAGASGADGDLRSNDVILELLAKERTLRRIEHAIQQLMVVA